ncbi:MAG: bifunctional metallophosphatase/5'-nucleotidase [Rhizobiales bacterium]|nr:bifunctional metallophosphatase/5'-nucleotidase [Hyphomicrobiales bacterium]
MLRHPPPRPKRMTRRTAAILIAVLAAAILALPARAQTVQVTFILVNDIYLMDEQKMADGKARGGFARLAAVVKAERAKGGHVIFAHAGDTLSPSLLSGIDRGEHIVALTNMVAPDIFVPGNHEFDFGKEIFLKRMGEAKFPRYAANLRGSDGHPLAGFKDRALLTFDGVRIGVTGTAADDSPVKSNPGDLKFASTLGAVKAQTAALRQEGADFVVAVVHADRRTDRALFAEHAADLILTGDDHDLFVNYNGRTAIVESSADAHYVTAVDVTIAVTMRDGRRDVTWRPQFRVIDTADVEPDAGVAAAVAEFERQLSKEFDVALATTEVELDSRVATVRAREAAIGNLFADAIRASTGADAAVTNGGGIRANRIYAPGSAITRRDILAELSFGNRIAVIEITGGALRGALENGLSRLPLPAGRFPQVSGIRIEADLKRPVGRRILSIKVAGHPLAPRRIYKIVTNDFLARGGDDYTAFRDAKHTARDFDAPLMANEVMSYVRKLGIVRVHVEGRVILK